MNTHLLSTFDPFEKPYPDMDMDDHAQSDIELRDPPEVADRDVIEHGRKAIAHFENPSEKGVYQQLAQAGLSKKQIQENLGAILTAAGPRFSRVYHAMRLPGVQ